MIARYFAFGKAPSSFNAGERQAKVRYQPSTATTAILVREGHQTKTSKRRLASPHHDEGDRRERGDIRKGQPGAQRPASPDLRGRNDHRHQPLPKRPRLL